MTTASVLVDGTVHEVVFAPAPDRIGLPHVLVNTASLGLYIRDVLFRYGGLGPHPEFAIAWSGPGDRTGPFGNWLFSYAWRIEGAEDRLVLVTGSGGRIVFQASAVASPSSSVSFSRPISGDGPLLFDFGTHWRYTPSSGLLAYSFEKLGGGARGRLSSITHPDGHELRFEYDAGGALVQVTDAVGRTTRLEYSSDLCTALVAPDGRRASFQYGPDRRLRSSTDFAGIASRYEYDPPGRITLLSIGTEGSATRFTYGPGSELATMTDPDGNTTRYSVLAGEPRRVQSTDAGGRKRMYTSVAGRTVEEADPSGAVVKTQYGNGRPVRITDRRGGVTTVDYDAGERVTRVTDPAGGVRAYSYDPSGRQVARTNPAGETTTYRYEHRPHQVSAIVSPSGAEWRFEYDERGQVIAFVDALGQRTAVRYDGFGNVVEVKNPMGHATTIAYDEHGLRIVAATNARGKRTGFEYDPNDRITRVRHPDGTSTGYEYGCCQLRRVIDEAGAATTYQRTKAGRPTRVTFGTGRAVGLESDPSGVMVGVVQPDGSRSTYRNRDDTRTIEETGPAGGVMKALYDPEGCLLELIDEIGNRHRFAYDHDGTLTSITDPAGTITRYERDRCGRVTSVTNGRGQRIPSAYDRDGRLVRKAGAALGYDRNGDLVSVADKTGTTTYDRDPNRRVSAIRYPDGSRLEAVYDGVGDLVRITYPGGLAVRYTRDDRQRIVRAEWGRGWVGFEYDPAGRIVRESRSNGVTSTCTYGTNGDLSSITVVHGDRTLFFQEYRYDANGNVVEEREVGGPPHRVESGEVRAEYAPGNRLRSRGGASVEFDVDGNQVVGPDWQAEYDAENRMTRLKRGAEERLFTHDGLGQRVQVSVGSASTRLFHDPLGRLVAVAGGGAGTLDHYVYNGDLLVARIGPGGDRFYHFDRMGNTRFVTDDAGAVTAAYRYDPFGRVVVSDGETEAERFTFAGRFGVLDEGGGLYFMRNRYYDGSTGRFLQPDPIGVFGGANLYAYVGGNPVNQVDPSGTVADLILMGLGLGLTMLALHIKYSSSTNGWAPNQINNVLQGCNTSPGAKNAAVAQVDPQKAKDSIFAPYKDLLTNVGGKSPDLKAIKVVLSAADNLAQGKPVDAMIEGLTLNDALRKIDKMNNLNEFPNAIGIKDMESADKVISILNDARKVVREATNCGPSNP
jgi:RHS repeat-associated protein